MIVISMKQGIIDGDNLQNEAYRAYIKCAWVELIWMTNTLKYGQENIDSKYHNTSK